MANESLGEADPKGFRRERVQSLVAELLEAMGEDPGREGLKQTPFRVAEMFEELLSGTGRPSESFLGSMFPAGHEEMGKVYREMRSGSIDPQDGTRMAYVLGQMVRLFEQTAQERRLEAIEQTLNQRKKP